MLFRNAIFCLCGVALIHLRSAHAQPNEEKPPLKSEPKEPKDSKELKEPIVDEKEDPALPPGLGEEDPALPPGLGEEDPALPPGLGEEDPALPPGLGEDEPVLPPGLGDADGVEKPQKRSRDTSIPLEWSAFLELRTGVRFQEDPNEERISMDETRFQLHAEKSWLPMSTGFVLTADFVMDRVLEDYEPELETGDGAIDLREAHFVISPLEWMDIKVGRQALTWGTGDLLFINDLFPKDWNAFLIGRDLEYLKAPSDAYKLSVFHSIANVDVVYTPRFDADRYPDRRRLSSWDPLTQSIVGRESELLVEKPDSAFKDDEWAARAYRRLGRAEVAAYFYHGFWKSPAGFNMATGAATFPSLSVYGASIRRPLLGGIAHVEAGYYDSRDDRDGGDALVRNSETRVLVGFEREAFANFSIGVQYYAEAMRDYERFASDIPRDAPVADEIRHLGTLRLRYLALDQNLELSFFGYLSPSDRDFALFPTINYAISDEWKFTTGANVFYGKKDHTFFGQLENNTNAYMGLRASWL